MMCGVAPDAPTEPTEANPTAPQERPTPKVGKNFSSSFFRKMLDVRVSVWKTGTKEAQKCCRNGSKQILVEFNMNGFMTPAKMGWFPLACVKEMSALW